MKAIMILIITAGTVQGVSLGPDQTLQVREIEFSTMASCREAAAQLVNAGRKSDQYRRIFSVQADGSSLVPAPVIIAECLER